MAQKTIDENLTESGAPASLVKVLDLMRQKDLHEMVTPEQNQEIEQAFTSFSLEFLEQIFMSDIKIDFLNSLCESLPEFEITLKDQGVNTDFMETQEAIDFKVLAAKGANNLSSDEVTKMQNLISHLVQLIIKNIFASPSREIFLQSFFMNFSDLIMPKGASDKEIEKLLEEFDDASVDGKPPKNAKTLETLSPKNDHDKFDELFGSRKN